MGLVGWVEKERPPWIFPKWGISMAAGCLARAASVRADRTGRNRRVSSISYDTGSPEIAMGGSARVTFSESILRIYRTDSFRLNDPHARLCSHCALKQHRRDPLRWHDPVTPWQQRLLCRKDFQAERLTPRCSSRSPPIKEGRTTVGESKPTPARSRSVGTTPRCKQDCLDTLVSTNESKTSKSK